MHSGHRERVREKFRKTGFAGFADHEILELLLFYAIPRADTNGIAHRLIDRFGSLSGVFLAGENELKKVEGIGENAAFLINMIPAVAKELYTRADKHPVFSNTKEAADYISRVLYGKKTECFYIFCLDMSYRLIYQEEIFEGSIDKVAINIRKIVAAALNNGAARLIISHNHPGGSVKPSLADINVTKQLMEVLSGVHIPLVDHIIVSDNAYYSIFASKLVRNIMEEEIGEAAQYIRRDAELNQENIGISFE